MYFDNMDDESNDITKPYAGYVSSTDDSSKNEVDDLPDLIDDEESDDDASEVDEEEIDEYEEAVERYAQLIREVPQDNLGGIVEIVEKIFEQRYDNYENADVICGVIVSTAVIVIACVARLCFS